MKNIIFMGTPDFSVGVLDAIHEAFNILLVVSQPDKPVGRKRILTPPPVITRAQELGLETFQPEKIKDQEAIDYIKSFEPDIIVTAAYGQILPKSLLEFPKHRAVNVHASLLPRHRGGAPIHRSIMEGDSESGVTIMYMEEGLDSGDIISQASTPITADDTTGDLHDRLSEIGASLIVDTLSDIFNDTHTHTPQDDSHVTFSPNISKEDEKINWQNTAAEVDFHIRGLSPWPGAYSIVEGNRMKFYFSKVGDKQTDKAPGTIVSDTTDGFLVAAGYGNTVEILEVQPAGKKRMPASNYINSKKELIGKIFE